NPAAASHSELEALIAKHPPLKRTRGVQVATGSPIPPRGNTTTRAHKASPSVATTNQNHTMKLTKALKLKNQLAGEVTELKDRLGKQNSRAATVPFDYDTREVLAALRVKI